MIEPKEFILAIYIIPGTPYCYMTLLPGDDIDRKCKSLLYKANKGQLPNKRFNELLAQSESKQVEFMTVTSGTNQHNEAVGWVKHFIDTTYEGDYKNNITNLDEIYYGKVSTVVMIKHSEEPGFVVTITDNYDKIAADREMAVRWYALLATKLPRLDAMIKRSGIEDTYHQVIITGDRDTCNDKARELINKYSDDIRCLNYTFS